MADNPRPQVVKQDIDPINIALMDVDKFVKDNHVKEVTSMFIRENSSNEFHHEGLFSETIFSGINTPERLVTFGYINLNTTILHPIIYRNIIRIKQFYGDIIANKQYAKWNERTKEFERCGMDDDDADTGFSFFMKHLNELNFEYNDSITHNEKIDVFKSNLGNLTISKCLVIPAGLRDMRIEDGKPEKDSINKLYSSLLAITKAIPARNGDNPVYNGHRFTIQKKVNEIYEYLFDMIQGKFGVFQRKYGSRCLALGTRNVISTTNMNAETPDSQTFFKIDEIKIPLFQCANMFMPLVTYYMKMLFFSDVFNVSSDQVAVIDPVSFSLRYKPITENEKAKFLSSDGVRDIVKLFRDEDFRVRDVTVITEDDEAYLLYLIYDAGDTVIIGRSEDDIRGACRHLGIMFQRKKVRPLNYLEMLYITVQTATENRNALVCRYPAIEVSSNVPCKVHVFTTNPGRSIRLYWSNQMDAYKELPEFPIPGRDMTDSTIPHPSLLPGLGGDHDGDSLTYSSLITYRYNKDFLDWIRSGDFSVSKQSKDEIIKNVLENTYVNQNGWFIAKHMIGDFPQEGSFTVDKHGAKVYQVPKGTCEILSFNPNESKECWAPIINVTAHDGADCCRMNTIGGKFIETTTNESVGIFDVRTGEIEKVHPFDCYQGRFIPAMKNENFVESKPVDVDSKDFNDGWILAALVSDGWVSNTYIGYAKNDPYVFEKVKNYILQYCDESRFHIYSEDKADGYKKFGKSTKFHATDRRAIQYLTDLNLYGNNKEHSALTKSLGRSRILHASRDFLFGVLCGMLDGDGVITPKKYGYDARIYTSSADLVDDIRLLASRLGIRCSSCAYESSTENAQEAYVISFSKGDFFANASNMMFYSQDNCLYHCEMLDGIYHEPAYLDRIPLTIEERDYLHQLAKEKMSLTVHASTMPGIINASCSREDLKSLIEFIDKDTALYHRIMNDNIYWVQVRSLTPMGLQPVYDFEVEGTKTFFVNDNLLTYDTVSVDGIISKEANEEINQYINSPGKWVRSSGSLYMGFSDLQKLTLWNLTREPDSDIKK